MSTKQTLTLPLIIGKLVLKDLGEIPKNITSPEKYNHVVKDIRYPTPIGYRVERTIKGQDEENVTFDLRVVEGKQGPWYVAEAIREDGKKEMVEGRSPTAVGNMIYEKLGLKSKISGPVFMGWEVKEICYLLQQLEKGLLIVNYNNSKNNTFHFPKESGRARLTSSASASASASASSSNPAAGGVNSPTASSSSAGSQQQGSNNNVSNPNVHASSISPDRKSPSGNKGGNAKPRRILPPEEEPDSPSDDFEDFEVGDEDNLEEGDDEGGTAGTAEMGEGEEDTSSEVEDEINTQDLAASVTMNPAKREGSLGEVQKKGPSPQSNRKRNDVEGGEEQTGEKMIMVEEKPGEPAQPVKRKRSKRKSAKEKEKAAVDPFREVEEMEFDVVTPKKLGAKGPTGSKEKDKSKGGFIFEEMDWDWSSKKKEKRPLEQGVDLEEKKKQKAEERILLAILGNKAMPTGYSVNGNNPDSKTWRSKMKKKLKILERKRKQRRATRDQVIKPQSFPMPLPQHLQNHLPQSKSNANPQNQNSTQSGKYGPQKSAKGNSTSSSSHPPIAGANPKPSVNISIPTPTTTSNFTTPSESQIQKVNQPLPTPPPPPPQIQIQSPPLSQSQPQLQSPQITPNPSSSLVNYFQSQGSFQPAVSAPSNMNNNSPTTINASSHSSSLYFRFPVTDSSFPTSFAHLLSPPPKPASNQQQPLSSTSIMNGLAPSSPSPASSSVINGNNPNFNLNSNLNRS